MDQGVMCLVSEETGVALLGISVHSLTCSPKLQTELSKARTSKNQVLALLIKKPNNGFVLGYFMSVM